jgi:hypothetical protein
MNTNFESAIPSTSSTDPVLDPQIIATFQSMIDLRMREMTEAHAKELAIRDAQVVALQTKLASFGVYVCFLL